jgi:glycerol uptake facilitator-like aquaporin
MPLAAKLLTELVGTFTLVAAAFAGGPISGGAFNPAVGFGATLGSETVR